MIGPYVIIDSDPPLTFLSVGDSAPGLSYPILTDIGVIRRPADGSETGNVDVELDNSDGGATRLLSVPPLRAAAILYGPDASVWFSGLLAGVRLAETATLSIES